jgi:AraC-like DNA-binding protein
VDPLADVLELGRVRGALLATVHARAPWGIALPQSAGASLHAVTGGICWLRVAGREPVQLGPGDVVLLAAGTPHTVSSDPAAPCRPFDRALKAEAMNEAGELALPAGGGAATRFVCAGYDYDLEVAQPLLGLLPEVLHLPADPVAGRPVAAILDLLAAEVGAPVPGAEAATGRLIDLLLIAALRAWIARGGDDGAAPSWLAGLRDPLVAATLALLHERPQQPWTLESLARAVHVSRATLARRFTAEVGEPPLGYLTRWRMELAARRLRSGSDSVERIAEDVGYSSPHAFNRAFRRHRGVPPGRYRRAA